MIIMPRVIRYFNKKTETLVGEAVLPEIPIDQLQAVFNVNRSDPMCDSFAIVVSNVAILKEYTNLRFDFHNYDYFLEYDA